MKTPFDAKSLPRDVWRALRSDLGSTARDPLLPLSRPRWLRWLPHVLVAWITIPITLAQTEQLSLFLAAEFALVLALVQGAAILVAMFRPVPAVWMSLAVVAVAALATRSYADFKGELLWMGSEPWPYTFMGVLGHAVVLLLLALRAPVRVAVEALVLSVFVGVLMELITGDHPHVTSVPLGAVVFTVAVVVGASVRGRRVASSRLVAQEVLTAEERTRRTVLEERSRIARELHDVVAHHMSVISIQAQVAPHLVEAPSAELKENLEGIRQNAVDALTELRRVLGVLRSENPEAAEAAPHAPLPTLDRLDALVDNARAAGLTVRCESDGERRALTPGVELSAYRIVQEALSNAIRHAPGSTVRIELVHTLPGLRVRVANTARRGAAQPSPGAGHGLLGMRERAAMLGGDLATGPTPDGGYEVTAFLPVNGENQT
ncbi:sensor histidine kinase [Streptomyces sp. NPDC051907]|uniref:sensor histidine kinase n=1 Tax=Streptomyces sp. NPDC051907 TaxID=3155284 RepID=UPI00341FBB9D